MVKIRKVRTASYSLIAELLNDIRKADLKELYMGPTDPFTAVFDSIEASRLCYQARDDKRLLAIFGVGEMQIDVCGLKATPVWMLGTNQLSGHNRAMVYYGKQFCNEFIKTAGPLCNFIWAGNEPAIRYIMHMGATLFDVIPMGRNGEMFVPFLLSEVK